uniref:SJCHGC08800 protein n=1 Tax=Schistosoma japonicum TaxID=6182 RepID=Q5D9I9_SCHJA|nr:SJCHGC08800 protein [Schistosoma japonicum]
MAHQLEDLPAVIYQTVRSRLRTHLGNSPIPRTASRNHNIEKCNITNECCFDDDGSFMFQELIDYNNNNNDIQSAQSTCSNQKRVKCEHGIPELSIQTMNTEQMNLQSKPNNFQSFQRTNQMWDSFKVSTS